MELVSYHNNLFCTHKTTDGSYRGCDELDHGAEVGIQENITSLACYLTCAEVTEPILVIRPGRLLFDRKVVFFSIMMLVMPISKFVVTEAAVIGLFWKLFFNLAKPCIQGKTGNFCLNRLATAIRARITYALLLSFFYFLRIDWHFWKTNNGRFISVLVGIGFMVSHDIGEYFPPEFFNRGMVTSTHMVSCHEISEEDESGKDEENAFGVEPSKTKEDHEMHRNPSLYAAK
ncbi:hypothetical protein CK203_000711 [Vitis vinifera]|uniref:Uncharacterized protein n=1 Tax=Vitis vinifera TaxID=29760 RepID=A0A438KRV7_VITVI|nr:hypothetical protein CK203_000711 [Vitis vinifera]